MIQSKGKLFFLISMLMFHSLQSTIVHECLTLGDVKLYEQNHVDIFHNETMSDDYTLKWKSKVTPGLFYAVVESYKEDYLHTDVMDLSDNRLDGAVLKNLLLLLQKVLTNGNQCPCGKGLTLIPKTVTCKEIDNLCHDSTIHVFHTGKKDANIDMKLMTITYNKSVYIPPNAEIKTGILNNFFQSESDLVDKYNLFDTTDDEIESLRSKDYHTPIKFKKISRQTNFVDIKGLTMMDNQESVSWHVIQNREFKVTIYLLRGPLLEDVAKADYLTETDGYITIEFNLCSPPEYCDNCVEKLLVDIVYESIFGNRVTCPTEEGWFDIPEEIEMKYNTQPSIIRCQLSEIMIVIRPSENEIQDPETEFQGFSLNLKSLISPCIDYIKCTGRDCSNEVL